jgi:hypothetical protein
LSRADYNGEEGLYCRGRIIMARADYIVGGGLYCRGVIILAREIILLRSNYIGEGNYIVEDK